MPNSSNFTITIDGGGSSSGARRVCSDLSDPEHVDIGDMSRNWKSSEATLLDDDYTWECIGSKLRVTQRLADLVIYFPSSLRLCRVSVVMFRA